MSQSRQASFDVVGIGSAIVDVLARSDDAFLQRHGLVKGSMALIDDERAQLLYKAMGSAIEVSGGSCANTIAGVAALGGKAAFIGKVRNDQLGDVFAHDMRGIGVRYDTPVASDGPSTARCLILVTPDAQRTMNTYLGACSKLGPDDIDRQLIAASRVTYIEGYLWDAPAAKQACVKAMKAAHQAGREVSFTLSDSFCVDRWRDEFRALLRDHVDILFANEQEILSLYQAGSFDAALQKVRADCKIACLTRSDKGSVIVRGDEVHIVDAEPIAKVIDTTGAGDLYAAGFLALYTRGRTLIECGRAGAIAAAEVISHFGARPEADLKALVQVRLGAL